mmetsp:Transcript_5321/g.13098  ORF Transcript_5321/g.13098 Transcript_5321/m.13098 type:complete len:294 (-) Transcript_5321:84-965(-)
MQERRLQNLSQFFHRLLGSTNIVVRHIGLVLYGHETHGGIDLGREWNLDRVFGTIDSDPHALLDIGRGHLFSQSHHKLGNLLDVDDVLVGSLCIVAAAAAVVGGVARRQDRCEFLCQLVHGRQFPRVLIVVAHAAVGGNVPDRGLGQIVDQRHADAPVGIIVVVTVGTRCYHGHERNPPRVVGHRFDAGSRLLADPSGPGGRLESPGDGQKVNGVAGCRIGRRRRRSVVVVVVASTHGGGKRIGISATGGEGEENEKENDSVNPDPAWMDVFAFAFTFASVAVAASVHRCGTG